MTHNPSEHLKQWIAEIAILFEKNEDPSSEHYSLFLDDPELALQLVTLINDLDENAVDEQKDYYSATVFALDICVAQLQVAAEGGNKSAEKNLSQLMSSLAQAIASLKHSLSFWLPILNAFYEVHVELSKELKEAYFLVASQEDDMTPDDEASHLNSMRELILELSDLSEYDIAENFFAQSYAMPADFFTDLVIDLYSIAEGQEIALLTLLHPNFEVREVVLATFETLMDTIILSPVSLSRLKAIKYWYPKAYHDQFDRWIREQRKKGVVYHLDINKPKIHIQASEVDGSGAQGIFIHIKTARKHRLCGLLFKQGVGIKDAWMTPVILAKDIKRYIDEAFEDSVMLREVDLEYLNKLTEHFLAWSIDEGHMPDLHLLEIQEALGLEWRPSHLELDHLLEELAIQISPFTQESINASFKRSKTWPKNKRFTETWYVENAYIDKLVNQNSSFIDGVKVCRIEEAMKAVFANEMEQKRQRWLFHFLWIALWMKASARKNEKIWQDSFMIAHAIYKGVALDAIPIMHEICRQSVINSIETMQERRTHLNRH